MDRSGATRRLPVGAESATAAGAPGAHFRVWAPRRRDVAVVIGGGKAGGERVALAAERDAPGYFSGFVPGVGAGTLYRFRLDADEKLYPDPASRFQPEGPHGPSQLVDPAAFRWSDAGWRGAEPRGQVIYEMHVGTFSPEGTWAGAAERLPALVDLGVTTVEVLPVAEFSGRFGWGYDGVDLFAPTRLYGAPDDFRRFVDRAHGLGLAVVLDVVYNHLGPDGNYLAAFSDSYTTKKYPGEWGDPINFDDRGSAPVRDFYVANAGYWIDEFHLDGLRLDATQCMHDDSPEHIIAALARRVREAGRGRRTLLVAENEPQNARIVRPPAEGGHGLDYAWNDDFHHSARVAATGYNEAYFTDHQGTAQELISAARHGYLFQGQRYMWQGKARGTSTRGIEPWHFVHYLQNHDQVANVGFGERLGAWSSPGRIRALTALLLLGPQTPMLFQGQEWGASAPWRYFADHEPGLAKLVKKGRFEFVAQFASLASAEAQARLPDPGDPATFAACKLDWSERESGAHAQTLALHRDLLALRRADAPFAAQRGGAVDGAVLGDEAFVLRFAGPDGEDRLLVCNLGRELLLHPIPEPLLAPPDGRRWTVRWSSEDPRYGGHGTRPIVSDDGWHLPPHATVVLAPDEEAS